LETDISIYKFLLLLEFTENGVRQKTSSKCQFCGQKHLRSDENGHTGSSLVRGSTGQ